jgi:hypothetical protein
MTGIPVDSSALQSVSYHHGCLEITFDSGHVYRYYGVAQQTFDALLAADSKGRYFHDHIRDHYKFARVD